MPHQSPCPYQQTPPTVPPLPMQHHIHSAITLEHPTGRSGERLHSNSFEMLADISLYLVGVGIDCHYE